MCADCLGVIGAIDPGLLRPPTTTALMTTTTSSNKRYKEDGIEFAEFNEDAQDSACELLERMCTVTVTNHHDPNYWCQLAVQMVMDRLRITTVCLFVCTCT